MDITSSRNYCTRETTGWLAVADVYAAHETRQPASGDLAKTPAVRHGAARKLGLPTAEQCEQRRAVPVARVLDPEVWRRCLRGSGRVHRQSLDGATERPVLGGACARIPGANSRASDIVEGSCGTEKRGSGRAPAEPFPGDCGSRFLRKSYARAPPRIAGTGEFAARSHGRAPKNQTERIQESNLGHQAKTGCGSMRVGLADSKIHRSEGAICVCTGKSGAFAGRPVRHVSRAWFRSSGRGLYF